MNIRDRLRKEAAFLVLAIVFGVVYVEATAMVDYDEYQAVDGSGR